jgi:hypothetical protein
MGFWKEKKMASKKGREFKLEVSMSKVELDALVKLGEVQLRSPQDVAFLLIRQALIREGAIKIPEKITGRG